MVRRVSPAGAAMAEGFRGFPGPRGHPCLGHPALDRTTRQLLANSLAPASQRAYSAGQACYRQFCSTYGLPETPASDATLTYFIGHLRERGLSLATANSYLAAARRVHLRRGCPMPPGLPPFATAALRGFRERGAQPPCRRPRLAIKIGRAHV